MYVCVCAGVTDQQIRESVSMGNLSIKALRDALGIAFSCGMCVKDTRKILDEATHQKAAIELATDICSPQKRAA